MLGCDVLFRSGARVDTTYKDKRFSMGNVFHESKMQKFH